MNTENYFLKKLSTKFGIIDLKKPIQISYLFELLNNLNIPMNIIQETITKLEEQDSNTGLDDKEKEKVKKLKLVSLGFGNWGKEKGGKTTHKTVDGKIVPVGDSEPEQQSTPPMKIDDNPFDKDDDKSVKKEP